MGFMEINKTYGKLDGSWIRWYSEGRKEEEGLYSRGIKQVLGHVLVPMEQLSRNGTLIIKEEIFMK